MTDAEYDKWSDPTAANYYSDDPPYTDALTAAGGIFGTSGYPDTTYFDSDYQDSVPVPVPDLPAVELPPEYQEQPAPAPAPPRPAAPARLSPARPGPAGGGRPPAWTRTPAPELEQPARGWTPQGPGQGRRRPSRRSAQTSVDTPTYSGAPTYQSTPTTYQSPPTYQSGRSVLAGPTATPPTVPWGRNPRPAAGTGKPRKTSALGCLPALFILGVVLFLSNGGAGVIKRAVEHDSVPTGVGRAVDTYYDAMATKSVGLGAYYICDTRQTAWTAGQTKATSDSKRGITAHTITAKKKNGSGWDVTVSVTTKPTVAPTTATIRVIDQDGAYKLCAGTKP